MLAFGVLRIFGRPSDPGHGSTMPRTLRCRLPYSLQTASLAVVAGASHYLPTSAAYEVQETASCVYVNAVADCTRCDSWWTIAQSRDLPNTRGGSRKQTFNILTKTVVICKGLRRSPRLKSLVSDYANGKYRALAFACNTKESVRRWKRSVVVALHLFLVYSTHTHARTRKLARKGRRTHPLKALQPDAGTKKHNLHDKAECSCHALRSSKLTQSILSRLRIDIILLIHNASSAPYRAAIPTLMLSAQGPYR